MNPQDPLAALHPLREPELIGWWPLAPGWWLVIALLVIALAVVLRYLFKVYRAGAYRRLAVKQLSVIYRELESSNGSDIGRRNFISATNALLKSVALRAFPRHDVAALSGTQWLEFLNGSRDTASPDTIFDTEFAAASYRRELPELSTEQLFEAAKNWITTHRGIQ